MFNTILFDLDGTICDSGLGVTRSVKFALEEMGYAAPEAAELTHFIGPPLRDSFMRYYGMSAQQAETAVAHYRARYSDVGIKECASYDGICELIEKLHKAGKTVALATSKPTVFAKIILEEYDIAKYFDIILGCEFDGTRGEKIEVMEECLEMLGMTDERRAHTVMIGDRHYDIGGAKHCGVASIGVTYGFAQGTELSDAGADYIVDNAEELERILMA